MPPRVSSSVHGLWPGERAMRFLSWHEFDADPRSMYNPPPESIAKGCIGWSPLGGRPCTMVSGAPVSGDHPMHPFAIDSGGGLYMDLGSASNSCQLKNRIALSPGHKPCTELETRGGSWRYDANRTG